MNPAPRIPADIRAGQRVTLVGALVNAVLVAVKLAAGLGGHSQALVADAIHSVSDLFTDCVVIFGLRRGRQPPDEHHPFGHGRIETLASAVMGLALIATALYLGLEAVENIRRPGGPRPSVWALYGAGASIALKEFLYRYTVHTGRRIHSQLLLANAWHHRSDALSSVAALVGVAGARIQPQWRMLDAIAALAVSLWVAKVGIDILARALRELSDAAPAADTVAAMRRCIRGVDGVLGAHDLRVRLSGGRYLIEVHIAVDPEQSVRQGHAVAERVEHVLRAEVERVERVIVHVDPQEPAPRSAEPEPGPRSPFP